MASVGTKIAAGTVGIDGGVVDEVFGFDTSGESSILALKKEIKKLIEEALSLNNSKVGFTFYIDDLDRIDPPVAVEILELLKNIFDIENCVFILAIDYDVIIKGLKPKFGELTDRNEREFRSFFDKIIQLPFSMPIASYNVDTFLVDALNTIEFFTPEELKDIELAENLSEIARLSVGSNPRSLKRLMNTLSLISIINDVQGHTSSTSINSKLLNFSLVCMQIAYPYIYNQLSEEPDFKKWNEKIASKLKLRNLTEEEKESLDAIDEFDEEWEKITFRMCQKETYLSNRVFSVSSLLNKIAELIGDDKEIGNVISTTIELSAVTNLKAFDGPVKKKFNRDTSDYRFNGKVYTKKVQLVRDLVLYHLSLHPDLTVEQLRSDFNAMKNMDAHFMKYDDYKALLDRDGKVPFYGKKDESDAIQLKDAKILISSNWPTTSQGKPAVFAKLLDVVKSKFNYDIETVS